MLLKTFVFSVFAMVVCLGPVRAEETASSADDPTTTTVAPHVKGAALTLEQKEKIKAERKSRREAWIKAHPEQLKQMQENRAKHQQWLRDNPEEAKQMKAEMEAKKSARKAKMQGSQAEQ